MRPISDVTGYIENPVKGPSTVFAILFNISAAVHVWQSSKYKSWYFTWYFPCACIIFTASFVCREYMAFNPTSDNAISAIPGLFYSAVPIITAPLYLFLSNLVTGHFSLIPVRPLYLYGPFICLTYVTISLTAQGASQFFSDGATAVAANSNRALLEASLIIQVFLNVAFLALLGVSYLRCSSQGILLQSEGRRIKTVIITLSVAVALVLVRNIFSTIQIFLPPDSPAWTTEAYFWVFCATPMLGYTILLHVFPPGKYFLVEGGCYTTRNATARVDNDAEVQSGTIELSSKE